MGLGLSSLAPMTAVVPYLCVRNAREALDWYITFLGAKVTVEPIEMLDDSIGHVEIEVFGGRVAFSDEVSGVGIAAPAPGRGAPVSLLAVHPDVEALAERVTAGGAKITRGPEFAGDIGDALVFIDPFLHRWFVHTAEPES